jgi:hypothetical protein
MSDGLLRYLIPDPEDGVDKYLRNVRDLYGTNQCHK